VADVWKIHQRTVNENRKWVEVAMGYKERIIRTYCLVVVGLFIGFTLIFVLGRNHRVMDWVDRVSSRGLFASLRAQIASIGVTPASASGNVSRAPELISGQVEINGASRRIYIGMSKEECYKVCGLPYTVNKNVGSWGTHEQVIFNQGKTCNAYLRQPLLYFENGVLTSWQE
jgi:hypothetical protein